MLQMRPLCPNSPQVLIMDIMLTYVRDTQNPDMS